MTTPDFTFSEFYPVLPAALLLLGGVTLMLSEVFLTSAQRTYQAILAGVEKLSTDEVTLNVIHTGVGAINESDIQLGMASNAIVIGFHVRPEGKARALAEREGVDVRLHTVIYEAIDEVRAALEGLLAPEFKEVSEGRAEVREDGIHLTVQLHDLDEATVAGTTVRSGQTVVLPLSSAKLGHNDLRIEGKLLMLVGDRDRERNVACARELVEKARAAGIAAEARVYPGAHHTYTSRNGTAEDRAAARDSLVRTRAFLDRHLK